MIYLTGVLNKEVAGMLDNGTLGLLDTPANKFTRRRLWNQSWMWAADNGAFTKNYVGDEAWMAWLVSNQQYASTCLFATAPDVVGDHAATVTRSLPWLPKIRALGYPTAFVAQDGCEHGGIPWDEFDVLFIGGSTEWKLGVPATDVIRDAQNRGKRVHCGRINSRKRFDRFDALGVDTCDGTFLAFGPAKLLPQLQSWIDPRDTQTSIV